MALTKVRTGGITADAVDNTILKLDDDYALTGIVTGTVAGSNAFSARNSGGSWATVADGSLVIFNDDSTGDSFDTDNCFNTSTYKFTAPATGVYIFWYHVYTANSDQANAFGFLKNSSKLAMNAVSSQYFTFRHSDATDHTQTTSVIVPLSSGDTMGVCATTGSDYYQGHTAWGGCRLA
jgi:hypothetical protein